MPQTHTRYCCVPDDTMQVRQFRVYPAYTGQEKFVACTLRDIFLPEYQAGMVLKAQATRFARSRCQARRIEPDEIIDR